MSKKIILKSLIFKEFKGIKELTINCNSKITNIFGDNGTGKTTVFDGFTWVLFDKDSSDVSKFTVQPLDENNNIIHMLETEVTAVLEIDGITSTFRKVLKEKWVKQRGESESKLKGTETSYYINDVPEKQNQYQKKVNEIIPENIFKLLTNPVYFSSVMKWQDRRDIIFELNGDVTVDDVLNSNEKLKDLKNILNPNESLDDFTKRTKAQKKKLLEDKKTIPARVDELNRTIKEDIDFDSFELKKKDVLVKIKEIEEKMLDSSKLNDTVLEQQNQLFKLKSELQSIENKAKKEANKPFEALKAEYNKVKFDLNSKQSELNYKEKEVQRTKSDIVAQEKLKDDLKKQWYEEDKKQFEFDEKLGVCPVCKRPFEEHDIETKKQELLANFNKNKAEKLAKITELGKSKNALIEDLEKRLSYINLEGLKAEIESLQTKEKDLESKTFNFEPQINLESNKEYQNVLKQINELGNKLSQPVEVNSQLEELKIQKKGLESQLQEINSNLIYKSKNEETLSRISELQNQEKALAQQIANLEKAEYLAETFIKTKVELLESSINSKFKYVKFRLFDTQVNGGLKEDCEVLVNGVPFTTNLNSAARINAGLDIINTLSKHYGVQAPIFIDNKESVTKLIDTDSQVINLIVSESDKKLRIENNELEKVSKEDKEYFDKKLEEIKENINDYSTGHIVEDIFQEAEFIKNEIVDQSRWSICKVSYYTYKGMYFAVRWDDPATEMQEGQDTNCELFKVKPTKKEIIEFI